jgi:triosephosphate isomerase
MRGLKDVKAIDNIIIAYEPVWAISRGDPNHKSATPEDAEKVHIFIRGLLKKRYNSNPTILYGGSSNPENLPGFLSKPDIDGFLPGVASLDPVKFAKMIDLVKNS